MAVKISSACIYKQEKKGLAQAGLLVLAAAIRKRGVDVSRIIY